MSPTDFVPFIVIASALLAGLLWLIRAQVSLQREFKPNGGGGGGLNAAGGSGVVIIRVVT